LLLRVDRIEAATPRIRRIELSSADGSALPAFTAGAHIDVTLPIGETRSYSLLNDQVAHHGNPDRYVIGVLRETESTGGLCPRQARRRRCARSVAAEQRFRAL
jgi:ferredoxin-NADP reductase